VAAKTNLKKLLAGKADPEFLDWLLATAKDLPDFRQRLHFYAATHGSSEEAIQAVNSAIEDVNRLLAAKETARVPEIVQKLTFLKQALSGCLQFGYIDTAIQTSEHAMSLIDHLVHIQQVRSTKLPALHDEFSTLHISALEAAEVDQPALAERLYNLRLTASGETLRSFPTAYEHILGKPGIAKLRELLDPTFQMLTGPTATDRNLFRKELRTLPQRRLMLSDLAPMLDDQQDQIAIISAMARRPDEIRKLIDLLDGRQLPFEALQHLKRHYERQPSAPLAKELAERHEQLRQFEEALEYRWYCFQANISIERYDELVATAGKAGQTKQWCGRAQEFAREKSIRVLVEILLRENRTAEALDTARQSGAPLESWAKLAEIHTRTDPRLAIHLYFDCAGFALNDHHHWAKDAPREYVSRAWDLASDAATFQAFNARLRALFSKTRLPGNFREKLEASGIPVQRLLQ
jgi:hypothetical protein